MENRKYDLFISHASEDKESLVRPLVSILERIGIKVWYDEFSLQLGDSLTESIDKGLRESKYGLVVLSKAFLGKKWTEYEYRSLMTREIDGERVILPLWYGVTKEDVKTFSLYLADIKAFTIERNNLGIAILDILKVVRRDILSQLRMNYMLRKAVQEGETKVVNLSEIKKQKCKQGKLTKNQLVRSKAIYYGIGKHLNLTFDEYVDEFELDLVPERELQTWEIMNACYFEMLELHQEATNRDKSEYYRVLLSFCLGMPLFKDVKLNQSEIDELASLWDENYYDF
ncbi:MAG: toll/interleukin-1 receptor domain-containing protein [Prevotellaceae bacterium]|nr:toll/interleukin-1 receptor domain-containing protein [Prevotellaceae bacterium]